MKSCPIVEHHKHASNAAERAAVVRLAGRLLRERPRLALEEDFRNLVPQRLEDAPTLHLDDLSTIARPERGLNIDFYQERARLRAGSGDCVASSAPAANGYEAYCREKLRLGRVEWLHPRPLKNRLRIAEACWEDEEVRSLLVRRIQADELRYLHPHMGTFAVWELGALLRDASGCPIQVIAPPPRVAAWVNDKVAFAEVVSRLFGPSLVPRTASACNFAILAQRVQELARTSPTIAIKLPNSAGGEGNVVLESKSLAGESLGALREQLKRVLARLNWHGESELLVDSWESDVICSPSAQLWIPPADEGEPIVEGIFSQVIEGPTGNFVGCVAATLACDITQEIATRCWLLGYLFQRLGYVGRCSFDLILVGTTPASSRIEFIECNGRWGGTSAPMTLMNRLFGDWSVQPYTATLCEAPGLDQLSFAQLLDAAGPNLLDLTSASGHILFFIPGRMAARSAIDVIAIGDHAQAQRHIASLVAQIHHQASARAAR